METIGEFLGFAQDKQVFQYFPRYRQHFFPALRHLYRTTCARQAANLWRVKQRLWQTFLTKTEFEAQVCLITTFAVQSPAKLFSALALTCEFRCPVSFRHLHLRPPTFTNCRLPKTCLKPSEVYRNYWSPRFFEELRRKALQIIAPFRSAKPEKKPFPRRLPNLRRRIQTLIGQLAERFSIKRLWVPDEWHFCWRRLRKVLAHTMFVGLCQTHNCEPLQMARLLSN